MADDTRAVLQIEARVQEALREVDSLRVAFDDAFARIKEASEDASFDPAGESAERAAREIENLAIELEEAAKKAADAAHGVEKGFDAVQKEAAETGKSAKAALGEVAQGSKAAESATDEVADALDDVAKAAADAGKAAQQYGKDAKKAGFDAEKAFNSVKSAASALLQVFIGAKVGQFFAQAINEAGEYAQALATVRARIEELGDSTDLTVGSVERLVRELDRETLFNAQQVADAQRYLLQIREIGEDALPQLTRATLDYATFAGIEAEAAAKKLTLALTVGGDRVKALGKDLGGLDSDLVDFIGGLVDAGRTADATTVLLSALAEKGVLGLSQAAAEASGHQGGLQQFKDELAAMRRELGLGLLPGLDALSEGIRKSNAEAGRGISIWREIGARFSAGTVFIQDFAVGIYHAVRGTFLQLGAVLNNWAAAVNDAFARASRSASDFAAKFPGMGRVSSALDGVADRLGKVSELLRDEAAEAHARGMEATARANEIAAGTMERVEKALNDGRYAAGEYSDALRGLRDDAQEAGDSIAGLEEDGEKAAKGLKKAKDEAEALRNRLEALLEEGRRLRQGFFDEISSAEAKREALLSLPILSPEQLSELEQVEQKLADFRRRTFEFGSGGLGELDLLPPEKLRQVEELQAKLGETGQSLRALQQVSEGVQIIPAQITEGDALQRLQEAQAALAAVNAGWEQAAEIAPDGSDAIEGAGVALGEAAAQAQGLGSALGSATAGIANAGSAAAEAGKGLETAATGFDAAGAGAAKAAKAVTDAGDAAQKAARNMEDAGRKMAASFDGALVTIAAVNANLHTTIELTDALLLKLQELEAMQ